MRDEKLYVTDLFMKALGENLAKLIKAKGLSYREVSLKAGKKEQFVYDIISGRSQSPSIESVVNIARVLNVPVSRLTGEKPNYQLDLDILSACFLWVLKNIGKLKSLPEEQIVEQLMRHYGVMLNERINDKDEAVRITRHVFDTMLSTGSPAPVIEKPASKTAKSKTAITKPKSSPRRRPVRK